MLWCSISWRKDVPSYAILTLKLWNCRLVNWSCCRVAAHMKWHIRRGAKPCHGKDSWLPNFGNQIVVRNLLSSLFVYFMRDWADAISPAANDWFSAVRSPHIARALARMHEAPERAWTLEELSQEAGLSRAAFARPRGGFSAQEYRLRVE